MPEAIDRRIKIDIINFDAKGWTEPEIAETLGVSERTVVRVKSRFRKFGDVEGGRKKNGRKSLMDPGMENVWPFLILLTARLFFV